METGTPASFIPHESPVMSRPREATGLPELVLLISVVLLVASGALAAGVFFYAQYLQTASSSKVQQLERAKAAFEPALIEQLMRLNDRMHAADSILAVHAAPSTFFDALSAATLSTVSFSTLDLQTIDNRSYSIKMAGVAQSVNSIALQAELFSKNGVVKDPIFSAIDREQDGVHFILTADIDSSAISFARTLSAPAQGGAPAQSAGAAQFAAPQQTQKPQTVPESPSPFAPKTPQQ
ncbi:MAG: hypothetical protein RLZZ342_232 [Candidatus Parcubacteria bacterium]|jgi:hypothetical protein